MAADRTNSAVSVAGPPVREGRDIGILVARLRRVNDCLDGRSGARWTWLTAAPGSCDPSSWRVPGIRIGPRGGERPLSCRPAMLYSCTLDEVAMADQGVWFKLWCSALADPDLSNLCLEDFARWAILGTYIKAHGTEVLEGEIRE